MEMSLIGYPPGLRAFIYLFIYFIFLPVNFDVDLSVDGKRGTYFQFSPVLYRFALRLQRKICVCDSEVYRAYKHTGHGLCDGPILYGIRSADSVSKA